MGVDDDYLAIRLDGFMEKYHFDMSSFSKWESLKAVRAALNYEFEMRACFANYLLFWSFKQYDNDFYSCSVFCRPRNHEIFELGIIMVRDMEYAANYSPRWLYHNDGRLISSKSVYKTGLVDSYSQLEGLCLWMESLVNSDYSSGEWIFYPVFTNSVCSNGGKEKFLLSSSGLFTADSYKKLEDRLIESRVIPSDSGELEKSIFNKMQVVLRNLSNQEREKL